MYLDVNRGNEGLRLSLDDITAPHILDDRNFSFVPTNMPNILEDLLVIKFGKKLKLKVLYC
jgi:hypothetical protein